MVDSSPHRQLVTGGFVTDVSPPKIFFFDCHSRELNKHFAAGGKWASEEEYSMSQSLLENYMSLAFNIVHILLSNVPMWQ